MSGLYRARFTAVHLAPSMSEPDEQPPTWFLKPRDQFPVLVVTASALVLMLVVWLRQGGLRGGLVEIDRVPPLAAKFQVDVNRADWPELIQIPGVGKITALKWIAERDRNGPFRDLDDLTRVDGIGPRTMARIRPYLAPMPQASTVADH